MNAYKITVLPKMAGLKEISLVSLEGTSHLKTCSAKQVVQIKQNT